jgi:hypothetical protein
MSDAASPFGVSPSAVDHARAYIGRRWSPIPIPEGKKGPQIPGWPNLRITEADAPRYFNGKCNIGINLGEASGGLTDLDLDCPEALDIAPKVLPRTDSIFGRTGKPRSHWLYHVNGSAPTKKFLDPVSNDVLLELRGDGGLQTVFPGSIHPSGERIEWETDGQPTAIDATELVRRAGWLAAFCLVKRYCQQVKDSASLPAALDAIDPRISSQIRELLGIQPANPVNPFNGAADGQGLGLGPRPSWLRPLPADESTRLWALSRVGLDDWEWSPTNEARLRSALSVIPAVNRDVWLRVGMALHATGWPNAFQIWDAWSRTCAEKYNEADQRRTWDSFHGPRAGASITLGTVFYLAIEHGWTEDRVPGDSGTRPETGQLNDAPSCADGDATKRRRDSMMSAAELRIMRFDPVRYVLPGFVPEGLTLLVGRPKIGKSWWALELGVACAANRPTLGTLTPEHGDVLYLALEDGWRRLQRRLDKLLGTFRSEWPERLSLAPVGSWPRADRGGLGKIEEWCKSVPKPVLIVIDTLERFRKPPTGKSPLYSADYDSITGLQKIATDYGIAIIVLHHDRKSDADDAFDTVSGTLGLTGAADTILIIKRRTSGVVLHARGRDIEESETAMHFEKETCRWTILGKASEVHRSTERARVIAALTAAGQPLTVREIMIDAEMQNRNAVDILLSKMAKDGEIVRVGRGRYHLSTKGNGTDRTERKI